MTATVKTPTKKYIYLIATHVSKETPDCAFRQGKVLRDQQACNNDPADILPCFVKLKALHVFTIAKALFCMEQTAGVKSQPGVIRCKYGKLGGIRIAGCTKKK